jgi:hypothetical protein
MRIIPGLLLGDQWVSEMSSGVLASNFSDQLGTTWYLYLEEMRAGANKYERIACANRIKSWVTDDTIQVHPKGKRPYQMRNRLQIGATSNFEDAAHIDNYDRRWGVCEIKAFSMSEAEANATYAFLHSDRGPGVMKHIFSNVSLTGFNPSGRAPVTASKKAMVQSGLGILESTLITAMANQEAPFERDVFELKEVLNAALGHHMSPHAMARMLQCKPFNCVNLGKNGDTRWWAWRNADLWRRFSTATRKGYCQSGKRPGSKLPWSDEIPASIREMAMDEPEVANVTEIPDSCADLF